jgi:Tic22-like family
MSAKVYPCQPPLRSRSAVLVYAIVSEETEKAVELFVRREDAEAFLDDVRGDDEELAAPLRVEPVELES